MLVVTFPSGQLPPVGASQAGQEQVRHRWAGGGNDTVTSTGHPCWALSENPHQENHHPLDGAKWYTSCTKNQAKADAIHVSALASPEHLSQCPTLREEGLDKMLLGFLPWPPHLSFHTYFLSLSLPPPAIVLEPNIRTLSLVSIISDELIHSHQKSHSSGGFHRTYLT